MTKGPLGGPRPFTNADASSDIWVFCRIIPKATDIQEVEEIAASVFGVSQDNVFGHHDSDGGLMDVIIRFQNTEGADITQVNQSKQAFQRQSSGFDVTRVSIMTEHWVKTNYPELIS